MSYAAKVFIIVCFVCLANAATDATIEARALNTELTDLDSSATSAKLFNLGSLFGQNPSYGYGYGSNSYYPSSNGYRPSYRPGYYPTTGSGSYYPNTGSYYPNSGGYYPTTSTGGWSGSWSGSQYPSSGYYPNTGSGYYPSTGTNILGGSGYTPYGYGGYGGYGGNGGLNQYSGYLNPDYTGQRNRGYGYLAHTDRYGFPQRERGSYERSRDFDRDLERARDYSYEYDLDRDHDRMPGGYRGYD